MIILRYLLACVCLQCEAYTFRLRENNNNYYTLITCLLKVIGEGIMHWFNAHCTKY